MHSAVSTRWRKVASLRTFIKARRPSSACSRRATYSPVVGLVDDGQVKVEQLVERTDRRSELVRLTCTLLVHRLDHTRAQSSQGGVGIDLVEADLDVPHADSPAALHVRLVVRTEEQLTDPPQQGAFEAIDLLLAACDDVTRVGVTIDLGVEIVDQRRQMRFEPWGDGRDKLGILSGPSHVGLEFPIAIVEPLSTHVYLFVPFTAGRPGREAMDSSVDEASPRPETAGYSRGDA